MERARAGLRAANRHAAPSTPGEEAQEPAGPPGTPPEVAVARAVLDFWQRVQGFAELDVQRRIWDGVGPDHPILSLACVACSRLGCE